MDIFYFTMMTIGLFVKAAAAGITATLAASSATNMYQTFQMMQSPNKSCDPALLFSDAESCSSVLRTLEGMDRKELLQVYMASEAPSNLDEVKGEWNGILLDNNLRIMVSYFVCAGICFTLTQN